MRFATLTAALAFVPAAFGTITIIGPNPSTYWVQNLTNVITWTFDQGDPNPIGVTVWNSNQTTLNGNFSISQYVNLANGSFAVTNVTLLVADNYHVTFVNQANQSQVLGTSQPFSVRAPGTAAAPPANSTSGSGSSTNTSASPTGTSRGNGSNTSPSPTDGENGAVSLFGKHEIFGVLAACSIASLSALLL